MDKMVMFVVMTMVGLVVAFAARIDGMDAGQRVMKEAASERGFGEWCAPDGRFAWKGECGS